MDYVIRNDNGNVSMATTNLKQLYNVPLEVEFVAIFWGFQLCLPLGINKL